VSSASQDIGAGGVTINVSCPANKQLVGGGFQGSSAVVDVFVSRVLVPGLGGTWQVQADDGIAIGPSLTAFAYCM
jgi:hypothetical protein